MPPLPPPLCAGTVVVLTSRDAQRTMLSYLGTPCQVPLDTRLESAIARSRVLVVEGYLWELPGAVQAVDQVGSGGVLAAGDLCATGIAYFPSCCCSESAGAPCRLLCLLFDFGVLWAPGGISGHTLCASRLACSLSCTGASRPWCRATALYGLEQESRSLLQG